MLANKALSAAPSAVPVYVEDVFSTYLIDGSNSLLTIQNNIDLLGKGGLVWQKDRLLGSGGLSNHYLEDTVRTAEDVIYSNTTGAQSTGGGVVTEFLNNGFKTYVINGSSGSQVSWTFAQQEKFFDVVTYTGNDGTQTINHNLGSVPGCIIVKATSASSQWWVYHRSVGNTGALKLNSTDATITANTLWNDTTPTSTSFTVGSSNSSDGVSYVAYLFAHDAGGFGASGSDSVIKCGSYTGNGSSTGPVIDLGWEPQWILIKNTSSAQNWYLLDNMRGMPVGSADANLIPNLSNAESDSTVLSPTATGFQLDTAGSPNNNGDTFIYIAIRRGPMKTPTSGTSVYSGVARSGTSAAATITGVGFAPDLVSVKRRDDTGGWSWQDRLRGPTIGLVPSSADAEDSGVGSFTSFTMDGAVTGTGANSNVSGRTYINHFFKRAPGVFDIVCYTGTGSNTTISHNLGVAPELWIVKGRDTAGETWNVGSTVLAATERLILASTAAKDTVATMWNSTYPTSTVFSIGTAGGSNTNTKKYVAYLFASVTGVSKVGSYTGNGSSQTINCGFTTGARFILIKQTDSTGNWFVYDSARGIVSGNDPQLSLNNSDGEDSPGYDAIDPDNSGFIVNNNAAYHPININNATYIYLAFA